MPLVEAWQELLDLLAPDLTVADHAPTLCLAAYRAVPTVLMGTGFCLPPATLGRFPPLVPGQAPVVPESQLLEVLREVQRRRGRPAPDTLPGLFAAADRFVTALPEIDPYPGREEPYVGPLEPLAEPSSPPAEPSYFAYLSADYGRLEEVLAVLAGTGCRGSAYLRGAAPALRDRVRGLGVEVLDRPRPLAEVVSAAAVVVHHGGAATTQFALSAGRPQLCLPQHLEQALTARCLHQLGVGHYLWQQYPAGNAAEALRQLAHEERFRARASAACRMASGSRTPVAARWAACSSSAMRSGGITPGLFSRVAIGSLSRCGRGCQRLPCCFATRSYMTTEDATVRFRQ